MNKIERENIFHYLVEWFYQEFSILQNSLYGQLLIGTTWTKTLCPQRNSKVSSLRSRYIATKSLSTRHIAQQGSYDVTLQIQKMLIKCKAQVLISKNIRLSKHFPAILCGGFFWFHPDHFKMHFLLLGAP